MTSTDLYQSDLGTLAFRIDPEDLGDLTCYEFGEDFLREWNDLPSQRNLRRPQFDRLATALKAMTSQPIRIQTLPATGPATKVQLYTTSPIPAALLQTTFAIFQQIQRGDSRDKLGDIARETTPVTVALANHITTGNGPVQINGQVPIYNITQWIYTNRLAGKPLEIDDTTLVLRPDTDGNLLAWNSPVRSRWAKNGREAIATLQLTPTIVTMAGAEHLYLRLEPSLSRVPLTWWDVKNTWIDHTDDKPLLTAPVRRGRSGNPPTYGDDLHELVQACKASPLPELPANLADANTNVLRAKGPGSSSHPIGKGVGVRTAHLLQRRISEILAMPGPDFTHNRTPVGTTHTDHIAASDLAAAVTATASEQLRIVCLYAEPGTRTRMLTTILQMLELDPDTYIGDDQETPLTDGVSLVLHYAPDLLRHGDHQRDYDSIEALKPSPGVAVAALVETNKKALDLDNEDTEPREATTATPKPADAKPQVRRDLARRGVISQFLDPASAPDPTKKRRPKPGTATPKTVKDHAAQNAVVDLFRHAGLLDGRLRAIVSGHATKRRPLSRKVTFVGVYVHENRSNKQRVVRITALHASPEPDEQWRLELHDPDGWLPYREAAARYHGGPIGKPKAHPSSKDIVDVRTRVEEALKGLPTDHSVVVIIDAEDGRRIWPGLTNPKHGSGLLPGHSTHHPDLAIVRVALTGQSLRPTHRMHGPTNNKDKIRTIKGVPRTFQADPGNPDLPGASLYAHTENDVTTWLFPRKSRSFTGSGGSTSARYTRWSLLPDENGKPHPEVGQDWHALNTTEISIPDPGSWEQEDLVLLIARLCQQPVSWDSRTKYPAPLHLAEAVYKDHPDCTANHWV